MTNQPIMRENMKQLIISLLLICSIGNACLATNKNGHILSKRLYGLCIAPNTINQLGNNIMVIFQDSKNNYWFGSWETGVYKYDGETIIHFTSEHGLPSNRIEEIKEDKSGNLFINTSLGLCNYDGVLFKEIKPALPQDERWNLQENDLWFKSPKSGYVCRYDGKTLTELKIPSCEIGSQYLAKNPSIIDPYGVYCIYTDSNGNIWFGTSVLGAMRYNGKSFDWISEPDVTEMHDGPSNGVRSILEDKDGYFWFNAAYRYKVYENAGDDSNSFYIRQKSIGNIDGNKDSKMDEYLSITKDNDNNLWIATYQNGVWTYDGSKISHYSIRENGKNIHSFYLYTDHDGSIWLGTPENGVWKFENDAFVRFTG